MKGRANAFLQVTPAAATAAAVPHRQRREKSSCMRAPGEWIRPWADADADGRSRVDRAARLGERNGKVIKMAAVAEPN